MSLNAATIRLLVEKHGFTAEDLLRFAEAVESTSDPTAAERQARYRARRDVSADEWERIRHQIFERDGHRCTYCGSDDRIACDHIVPLVDGGRSIPENLTTACKSCNSGKGGRTPEAWLQ